MDDNSESYIHQAQTLFVGYLNSLKRDYVVENLAGAAGDTLAQVGYISCFSLPSLSARPIYHTLKFGFSYLGKNLVYALSSASKQSSKNHHPKIADKIKCEIIEDDFVMVDYENERLSKSQMNPKRPAEIVYQFSDGCKEYFLTLKPIDLLVLTGSVVGAGAADLAFAVFVGPPGWMGIPALLITEVMAQGFGEYLAKKSASTLLGKEANVPFSEQALRAGILAHSPSPLLYHFPEQLPETQMNVPNLSDCVKQAEKFKKPPAAK